MKKEYFEPEFDIQRILLDDMLLRESQEGDIESTEAGAEVEIPTGGRPPQPE